MASERGDENEGKFKYGKDKSLNLCSNKQEINKGIQEEK